MVYKITSPVNCVQMCTYVRSLAFMKPNELYSILMPNRSEAVAKDKNSSTLYRISTHLLGYVVGTRAVEGEGDTQIYRIRWETKQANYYYQDEDIRLLMRLRDIIILGPEEFVNHIKHEQERAAAITQATI